MDEPVCVRVCVYVYFLCEMSNDFMNMQHGIFSDSICRCKLEEAKRKTDKKWTQHMHLFTRAIADWTEKECERASNVYSN